MHWERKIIEWITFDCVCNILRLVVSCNNRVYFYTRQWYNTKHIPTLHSSCNFIALNVRVKGDIIDFISFSRWRCATRCWILVSTKHKLFFMWPLSNIYLSFFRLSIPGLKNVWNVNSTSKYYTFFCISSTTPFWFVLQYNEIYHKPKEDHLCNDPTINALGNLSVTPSWCQ